ncbi:hypothetical protein [Pleionea sp. CnH1-48]|uniref:GFA family protein n=1 Tax=Pleionea sp. CnH1-48 TaxID=2954494 RepID=UPI0020978593|nr:hypothetical protein [Pleionea sp. CnH1-48]MCO7223343.1 hypothetical protein [Pleionea sp. CnH1-48]
MRGSCLCGKVVFEINGELTIAQPDGRAQCCGLDSAELLVEKKDFVWLTSLRYVKTYQNQTDIGSLPYSRSFCTNCGTCLPVLIDGTDFYILQSHLVEHYDASEYVAAKKVS